ncbi:radical SAM protein [Azospirillum sp.]|uniref:radical SAM protein n=1 Tax=Azospirillum sp. TaxID=34012 RepID=UPI002D45CA76|nr:radical SAM protein [Azospirillum sp.]HYD70497.1 radical SAM protein [Azospirillum sp.]
MTDEAKPELSAAPPAAETAPRDRYNMDGHKLFWHLDRVVEWQQGRRIAPLHIDMGITTGCNMACTYCYGVIQGRSGYGTDKKGRFNMPKEAVMRTFSDAKTIGVRSIALIGEGENTLHPDFHEILAHARTIGLDISLATNGIRIDREPDKLENMLTALKWLRVNISAASDESFQKIHQVPQFERVIGNVEALVAAKRRGGFPCTIGLQMVVTKENMGEIVPLAKLGRDLGVDYLVVKSCSDTYDGLLDGPREEYKDITGLFKEAESYGTADYTVSIKWHKLTNAGWKDYGTCFGTQFLLAISGNGGVFPCGHWFDVRRDEFRMGNVIEQSFRDIVESERYWEVQKRVQTVNVNHDCESNCRQHYINRFLWQVNQTPTHMNFI